MTDTVHRLDERVQSLAGGEIIAVRYFQLTSEVDDRSWERDQGLHVVDLGIDMIAGSSVHRLTWDRSPVTYSITLQDGSMVEELLAGRSTELRSVRPGRL